jgi:hypothetical protein
MIGTFRRDKYASACSTRSASPDGNTLFHFADTCEKDRLKRRVVALPVVSICERRRSTQASHLEQSSQDGVAVPTIRVACRGGVPPRLALPRGGRFSAPRSLGVQLPPAGGSLARRSH